MTVTYPWDEIKNLMTSLRTAVRDQEIELLSGVDKLLEDP
jgi:hypothetical protein